MYKIANEYSTNRNNIETDNVYLSLKIFLFQSLGMGIVLYGPAKALNAGKFACINETKRHSIFK